MSVFMKALWERRLSKKKNNSGTPKTVVVEAKFDFDERKVL